MTGDLSGREFTVGVGGLADGRVRGSCGRRGTHLLSVLPGRALTPVAALRAVLVAAMLSLGPVLLAEETGLSVVARDIAYANLQGSDAHLQTLDIYYQTGAVRMPVIVYVHGGGWAFGKKEDVNSKPQYFLSQDIAFVSMNYRLRWDYAVYDQAEDIVSVINWVRDNAETYGLDSNRIILMGHAAGAHLVSLVATNPSFLKAGNRSLRDVAAVIAIDTDSYDIVRTMIELGSFVERRQHRLIFGNDQEVWYQASPVNHVAPGLGIPSFALLYVVENEQSTLQARGFAKALSRSDVETVMIPGNEKTSDSIDEELGQKGDGPTQALMTFLRAKI